MRDAAKCVMRQGGLGGGNYAVVHARFSAEKKKERGSTLPPLRLFTRNAHDARPCQRVTSLLADVDARRGEFIRAVGRGSQLEALLHFERAIEE